MYIHSYSQDEYRRCKLKTGIYHIVPKACKDRIAERRLMLMKTEEKYKNETMAIFRHLFSISAIASVLWVYIDTPKQVYFCPLSRAGLNDWSDENCYWSTSYAEAREKFVAVGNRLREQVASRGGEDGAPLLDLLDVQSISYDVTGNKSFKVFDASTQQTILPENDSIDAILLTMRVPDDHIDIIHSSGTHGVEGYLGSAVQLRFLHSIFLQNEEHLLQSNGQNNNARESGKVRKILLIHAVNPYGMRHHRRTNENNVDLNRNVLANDMIKTVIERNPNYFGYEDMDPALNPVYSPTSHQNINELPKLSSQDTIQSFMQEFVTISTVIWSIMKIILLKGYTNAKRTVVSAQYHKNTGVFYGGNGKWENSIVAVQHAIDEFADFRLNSVNPDLQTKVFWIDIHTGLGKYGSWTSLSKNSITDNCGSWTSQLNSLITSLEEKQASNRRAVNSGYEHTVGFVNGNLFCPFPSCFAITQEFGTRPGLAVILALVLENKGFNWGKSEFAFLTSNAFQPQRLSWRRSTLRGGTEILQTAINFRPR